MRPEAFERVELRSGVEAFPLLSEQSSSRPGGIFNLALMSVLAAAIVLPQLALAVHALSLDETRALILSRPLLALDMALAIVFWLALFAWPLKRLVAGLNWRRNIEITRDAVAVRDDTVFGPATWTAPLKDYIGIAHHVRTSLGTARHELVLVHPERGRSVLLLAREHISDVEVRRFCRLLGQPEISPKAMYRLRRPVAARAQSPAPGALAAAA
jgi:hypothetical protein